MPKELEIIHKFYDDLLRHSYSDACRYCRECHVGLAIILWEVVQEYRDEVKQVSVLTEWEEKMLGYIKDVISSYVKERGLRIEGLTE